MDARYRARDEVHHNVEFGLALTQALPGAGEEPVLNSNDVLVVELFHYLQLAILNGLVLHDFLYRNDLPCQLYRSHIHFSESTLCKLNLLAESPSVLSSFKSPQKLTTSSIMAGLTLSRRIRSGFFLSSAILDYN